MTDSPLGKLPECRGGIPGPQARPFWVTLRVHRVSAGWHLPGSPLTSRTWGAFYSWKEAAVQGWGWTVAAKCWQHRQAGYGPDPRHGLRGGLLTGPWRRGRAVRQAGGFQTGSGDCWQTGQIPRGASLHFITNTGTRFVLTTPEAQTTAVAVSWVKPETWVQVEGPPQVTHRTGATSRCVRLQSWPLLGQGTLPPAPTRAVPASSPRGLQTALPPPAQPGPLWPSAPRLATLRPPAFCPLLAWGVSRPAPDLLGSKPPENRQNLGIWELLPAPTLATASLRSAPWCDLSPTRGPSWTPQHF